MAGGGHRATDWLLYTTEAVLVRCVAWRWVGTQWVSCPVCIHVTSLQPEVTCCSGPAFSGDTGPPPAPLAGEALGAGAE